MIVPGYFGEKHVKWITRIELTTEDAKGFYETQGWGPDFITPTRSRIDVPDQYAAFSLSKMTSPIEVTGPVELRLWAASSASDTDFTATLVDVFPDGTARMLADGILRALEGLG